MSLQACAEIVFRGDPIRFRTVMAAPPAAREKLFPLYAFNVEVSRAPWVTREPMIAEMRLQWWHDALEEIATGQPVRRHEVTGPLGQILTPDDARRLDGLVTARAWDIYSRPFEDLAGFHAYLDATAGHLMITAASLLGHPETSPARTLANAAGLAAFLRAVPALEAAGRIPLVDGSHAGLKDLASTALGALKEQGLPRATPAFWPAIGTRATLRQVLKTPAAVSHGHLSPGMTRPRFFATIATGRLW